MAQTSLQNSPSKTQPDARRKDERFRLFAELYHQGLSLAQIGRQFSTTRQSVYAGLKSRGVALRSPRKLERQEFNGLKFSMRNHGYFARTDGDRCLMHRYVWQFHNGMIPVNHDIHHINHDRSDNRIENLECLSKSDHARLYSTGCNQNGHKCGK